VCGGLGVGGQGVPPYGSVPDLMLSELVNFINPTFSSYRHSLSSIACGSLEAITSSIQAKMLNKLLKLHVNNQLFQPSNNVKLSSCAPLWNQNQNTLIIYQQACICFCNQQ
jgi:hypothetical protein